MEAQGVAAPSTGGLRRLGGELQRLAQLERNLGILLAFTPLLLVVVDERVRASISAYHDMGEPWAFYVPLTAGAMLFLVNGMVKNAHLYNTLLGLALLGVIVFDEDAWEIPHFVFAVAFFGGNFFVALFCSTGKSRALKIGLGVAIAAAFGLWALTSLFWFEWASLAIVTVHFILDSASWSDYRALEPGEAPKLIPATR